MTANASVDVVAGIMTLNIINPMPAIIEILSVLARRYVETMSNSTVIAIAM